VIDLKDVDIMARTMYGEAEADNEQDALAIGCVIRNRAKYARFWPNSIAGVCLQPWQFSCWNPGDPNRQRILVASDIWFERCKQMAAQIIKDEVRDMTARSTHYYETGIKKPKWAKNKTPVLTVRHGKNGKTAHVFFNNIDTPSPDTAKEALDQIKPLSQSKTIKGSQIAGIATAGSLAVQAFQPSPFQQISDGAAAITPALPVLQLLAEYAPIALGAIALAAIGYIIYTRIQERVKGKS